MKMYQTEKGRECVNLKTIRIKERLQEKLQEKLNETLKAVLPIIAIVLVLCFTIAPLEPGILLAFLLGAVLLTVGTINEETASAVIPEKDDTVLVYCRSGNRSKTASAALAELGYTNIYEFGGINTWPYEIEQ